MKTFSRVALTLAAVLISTAALAQRPSGGGRPGGGGGMTAPRGGGGMTVPRGGGYGGQPAQSGGGGQKSAAAAHGPAVTARKLPGVGMVLVDRTGKTVYSPQQEAQGKILCTGSCLS